ncbi:MAG TPA: hypothetical protein VF756_15825 [Thermoanaerobaculia bacterium]
MAQAKMARKPAAQGRQPQAPAAVSPQPRPQPAPHVGNAVDRFHHGSLTAPYVQRAVTTAQPKILPANPVRVPAAHVQRSVGAGVPAKRTPLAPPPLPRPAFNPGPRVSVLQPKWVVGEDGKMRWDDEGGKDPWIAPLVGREPDPQEQKLPEPRFLIKGEEVYGPEYIPGKFEVHASGSEGAKKKLNLVKFWRSEAKEMGMNDSVHILGSILELIEEESEGVQILFAYAGHILMGVSCFEMDGQMDTSGLAPNIDDVESGERSWIYILYTAANPFSLRKVKGSIGTVGTAINAWYARRSQALQAPSYQYPENPGSFISAQRGGFKDVKG